MGVRRVAFTLVEVLIVLAIIAVLAAILFPVYARSKAQAVTTTCLAQQRQLGLAVNLYAQDSDDHAPSASDFKVGKTPIHLGFGWAGKVFRYAKNAAIYRCPTDSSRVDSSISLSGASVLSHAFNENLISISLSESPTAARSILLFEVSGSAALLTEPDEGASLAVGRYLKHSAAGNGIKGSLIDSAIPWPGPGNGLTTFYATGFLDNAENDIFADDMSNYDPRHSGGASYLMLDGHAVWSEPNRVSAGVSAKDPSATQSRSGCAMLESTKATIYPCAEGTAVGKHKITFSRT